jgi:phage gpG-like protein
MISLQIDSKNALGALDKFSAAFADRRLENRKVAIQFFGFVSRNFQAAGALQPGGWRPLAPSTLKAKQRAGYSTQPLLRTGNLRNSFLMFSDNDQAGVGAQASFGVDYAEVHEKGSSDGRIPARPMLPPLQIANRMVSDVYGLKLLSDRNRAGL